MARNYVEQRQGRFQKKAANQTTVICNTVRVVLNELPLFRMHRVHIEGTVFAEDQSAFVMEVSRKLKKSIAAAVAARAMRFSERGTNGVRVRTGNLQFAKEPTLLSIGGRWMAVRIGKRRLDVCQWRVLDQPVLPCPFAGQPSTFLAGVNATTALVLFLVSLFFLRFSLSLSFF